MSLFKEESPPGPHPLLIHIFSSIFICELAPPADPKYHRTGRGNKGILWTILCPHIQ